MLYFDIAVYNCNWPASTNCGSRPLPRGNRGFVSNGNRGFISNGNRGLFGQGNRVFVSANPVVGNRVNWYCPWGNCYNSKSCLVCILYSRGRKSFKNHPRDVIKIRDYPSLF